MNKGDDIFVIFYTAVYTERACSLRTALRSCVQMVFERYKNTRRNGKQHTPQRETTNAALTRGARDKNI